MESLYQTTSHNSKSENLIVVREKNQIKRFTRFAKFYFKPLILPILLLLITYKISTYFFYVDIANACYLRLNASYHEFNNGTIVRSIHTLKKASPHHYSELCEHVDVISPNISCGGVGGGCYMHAEPRKIYVTTFRSDLLLTAAVLAHEVCHAKQANENRPPSEQECYIVDDEVIKTLVVQ